MNITPSKVIKSFDASEYANGFTGTLDVWVNPPNAILVELSERLQKVNEGGVPSLAPICSQLLSQGDPKNAMTEVEFIELYESTKETDPLFLNWVLDCIVDSIHNHRMAVKKS